MKAYATCQGDRSVGIPGDQTVIELEDLWFKEDSPFYSREAIREGLTKIFSELFDELTKVAFEDECPDCLDLKEKCKGKEHY